MSLLSVKQNAKFWGFSESWVYRNWRELQGFKVSSRIRFDIEEQKELKKTFKKNFQKRLTIPPSFNTLALGGNKMAALKKGRRNYGFGSIYRREKKKKGRIIWTSKKWTIDFVNEHGDRIQKTLDHAQTEEEAFHALMFEVQKVFDRKYKLERRRREIGFKTFAQIYVEDYMMTARRNFQSDVYRLNELNSFFKDTDLRDITPFTVERFRKSRLKAGNSKSTVNRYTALLKTMLNTAIQENYAEENPVTKVKLYSEKDNLCERILTEQEEIRLYEASANYLRPIITVALNTGMRKGEILNLKWSQVDLKAKRLRVEKTKSQKLRFIPMNDNVFNELNVQPKDGGVYVFANPATGRPYYDVKRQFRNACLKADIEGLRFHDLRHTFATRLVEKGIHIKKIRDLLGHFSVTVTERYTHSTDEGMRKAVELLDRKDKVSDNLVTIQNQSKAVN